MSSPRLRLLIAATRKLTVLFIVGWETGYAINLARDFGPRLMSYFLGMYHPEALKYCR